MTMTQKEIARVLDRCAARCADVEATPASAKQIWYLAGLLVGEVQRHGAQSVEPLHNADNYVLTARRASHMIDVCKGQ